MKSGDTYISSSNINLGTGIGPELKKGKTTKISTNNEITKNIRANWLIKRQTLKDMTS